MLRAELIYSHDEKRRYSAMNVRTGDEQLRLTRSQFVALFYAFTTLFGKPTVDHMGSQCVLISFCWGDDTRQVETA